MMSALQTEVERRDAAEELHVHFRNCNDDSVYRTVRSLINSIRGDEGETFPETGLSTSHALETLYEEMEASVVHFCSFSTRSTTFLTLIHYCTNSRAHERTGISTLPELV